MTVPPRDSVGRQADAYNAHDLDEFMSCYAEAVVVEEADGRVVMDGREQMCEQYASLFAAFPDLKAEIVSRMRVGSYVVDEERVTGTPEGDVHAIAIYRLDHDGLIDSVRFLR